ncbi:putative eukaryotic initiation factor 5A [Pavlovales sp. CCMP2436]|nr:putative eukaryotic initiation factor 5A [Pavlovales sp. CCMP2436]
MADVDDTEQFEGTDSGASGTYPLQAGLVRKGGHMVIKGRPCKVLDVSTSKTGKHGHAKCHFIAQDIFTGKKMEDLVPSSHNLAAPIVTRVEYQIIDTDEDGFASLLLEDGSQKDDLKLPLNTNDALCDEIKAKLEGEKDVFVTVLSAMGEDLIVAVKEAADK